MSFKVQFSHIAEIIMGQSPKGEEVNNEGIGLPLLNGPTEFTDHYPLPVQHTAFEKKTSLPGDILFCVRGSTTGKMNYSDQKYCIGRGLAAIRGRNGYPTPYVKAVLEACLPELLAAATGSTFPNVSRDLISNISVDVLSVDDAYRISKFIESQEGKVFNNNGINQTLEQIAQALFKSWFVDFEPVKAKIAILEAGGSQEEATLAAMAAISGKDADSLAIFEQEHPEKYAELRATAKLFPSVMQESELGIIPEQWHVESIKSLTLILSKGTTPAKKDIILDEPQVINFLKVKDISNNGEINSSGLDKISKRVHENLLKRSILKENDLLFSIAGTIGRVSVVTADILDCNCNQAIAFVRLEQPSSHLHLVRMNLLSSRIQQEVESKLVQGVQANLSLTSLGDLKIILPSNDILNVFNGIIAPIWEEQHSINRQSNYLSQLRDTLLPKLLSGEITLPEAEELAKEADYV
ncbi:restriction endonuclease subunit S [Enterobacter cloacae]|uniref:restriction endonuclease subunit S n=1 Tax=Enterobacter cloacae TaxID=550 RepID=UPI0005895219|nr:restriction endonuclease subunit S [Enterobacter cloacae]KIF97620.1 hypothetical protein SD66_03240 [Enterobacter cloacae]